MDFCRKCSSKKSKLTYRSMNWILNKAEFFVTTTKLGTVQKSIL